MNEKRKHKLSEIDPSELSLVRRGAVKRPWLFFKTEDEEAEVEAEVERRIAEREPEREPVAKGESLGELLARFEKATGVPARPGEMFTEYAARARLETAEGRSRRLDELIKEREGAAVAEPDGARIARQVDARAIEITKADSSLTAEMAIVKAYGELSAAEYQALNDHYNADQADLIAKAEAEQAEAERTAQTLPVAVQKAADEVRWRRGNEAMTREQAVARALNENPQLYELWEAVDAREGR